MHQQNIRNMYKAVETNHGFDVIIVVSSSDDQANFWQQRLTASRGAVIGSKTRVISLEEDWSGGAGQLLGTLYAWKKAQAILDLNGILENGGTIAMYHTAGKGTRMAPLPASETNNKSAIKLPRLIETNGEKSILTVLEAVIFQTGIFAASRKGRLCVFWGDQVFIPSKKVDYEGRCHAEILDIRDRIPSDAETWKKEWQSYGLIIPTAEGGAMQREKQTWEELQNLIASGTVRADSSGEAILGKSLGCFSISNQLLRALLEESAKELAQKQLKLDTDPHLWMPLTSEREEFAAGGGDIANWKRVINFRDRFREQDKNRLLMFGDMDLGAQTLWWDYGQIHLYHQNFLKALEDSFEGECLRQFYDLDKHRIKSSETGNCKIDNSIMIDTHASGKISNCVLISSMANNIEISDSVLVNSVLAKTQANQVLMYNCAPLANANLGRGDVVADIFLPRRGRMRMVTALERNGKDDWEIVIPGNPCSYAELARLVESSISGTGERQ